MSAILCFIKYVLGTIPWSFEVASTTSVIYELKKSTIIQARLCDRLPGTTRYYQVLPGTTRYYQVLPGTTRYYQVLRTAMTEKQQKRVSMYKNNWICEENWKAKIWKAEEVGIKGLENESESKW